MSSCKIISKIDYQIFKIGKNVINASVLLKNICDLTERTEAIEINCCGKCFSIYINLFQRYQDVTTDKHDIEFENNLFNELSDREFVELIQEMCILDSDFFFEAAANFILGKIEKMEWKDMQEYFELEDDFSQGEREMIAENRLEYLLSMKLEDLEFPFPEKNFTTLNNKYYTPMNSFLAKIIQLSSHAAAWNLSLINKTLKNEANSHPIKLSIFQGKLSIFQGHFIEIHSVSPKFRYQIGEAKYFDVIKKRKAIVDRSASMSYIIDDKEALLNLSSGDFLIPRNTQKIEITFYENFMAYFDIKRCPFPVVHPVFTSKVTVTIDEIYDHLVAKDVTKEIE
uniref:Uncharacterized protein n=1 Tax=Panagrolaimus sp. ES5 TaxID=591445 RepID=A0AC34FPE3_9BILA